MMKIATMTFVGLAIGIVPGAIYALFFPQARSIGNDAFFGFIASLSTLFGAVVGATWAMLRGQLRTRSRVRIRKKVRSESSTTSDGQAERSYLAPWAEDPFTLSRALVLAGGIVIVALAYGILRPGAKVADPLDPGSQPVDTRPPRSLP